MGETDTCSRTSKRNYLARSKDVCWPFMDLEKSYDRIDRARLCTALRVCGFGGRLLLLKDVQSFYVNSKACVRG